MCDQERLRARLREKEAELRELREARGLRPKCAIEGYSRADDTKQEMRIELLEEEIAELKRHLAQG